jgi:hypothetical protein
LLERRFAEKSSDKIAKGFSHQTHLENTAGAARAQLFADQNTRLAPSA